MGPVCTAYHVLDSRYLTAYCLLRLTYYKYVFPLPSSPGLAMVGRLAWPGGPC